jgi:hypothetical protein
MLAPITLVTGRGVSMEYSAYMLAKKALPSALRITSGGLLSAGSVGSASNTRVGVAISNTEPGAGGVGAAAAGAGAGVASGAGAGARARAGVEVGVGDTATGCARGGAAYTGDGAAVVVAVSGTGRAGEVSVRLGDQCRTLGGAMALSVSTCGV